MRVVIIVTSRGKPRVNIATTVIVWGEGGGVSGPRRRVSNAGSPATPNFNRKLYSSLLYFCANFSLLVNVFAVHTV